MLQFLITFADAGSSQSNLLALYIKVVKKFKVLRVETQPSIVCAVLCAG